MNTKRLQHGSGFTLIETLGWMSLLAIFMLMSSQAFMQTKNLMIHTKKSVEQVSQMDGVVRHLRRDVWPSESVTTIEAQEDIGSDEADQPVVAIGKRIVLKGSDGREVVWTWGRHSPAVRRVEMNGEKITSDLQWKNTGDNWLEAEPWGVTLFMQNGDVNTPPQRMAVVSQSQLLQEMGR